MDRWEWLLEAAQTFDEYHPPEVQRSPRVVDGTAKGDRPGDVFNRQVSWADILQPHGWKMVYGNAAEDRWRRPGKDHSWSATTRYCKTDLRGDLLHVFTSNAPPFEEEGTYSKFEAKTLLEYGGDWAACAQALAAQGYGAPAQTLKPKPAPYDADAEPAIIDPADVATIDDLIREGAEVRWLWEGWIPVGVLTAVAALGGTGKTRFCADLMRRIVRRLPWPDGRAITLPSDALVLWVVSDNHHDEMVTLSQSFGIVPNVRINATKADPYGGVTLEEAQDYADLAARIKAVKPALVIVDTVGNATDKNLSKQEDAKAFYWPLQIMARKYRTAILCLTHLNAGGQFLGRRVLEKVRVAIRMEQPDPSTEKRRLEVVKSNAKRPAALGLTMGDAGNEYDDHPPERPEDESEPGKPRKRTRTSVSPETEAAADWLREKLASGPRRVSITRDEASREGISVGTLYNAKRLLKVEEFEAEHYKYWQLTTNKDEE